MIKGVNMQVLEIKDTENDYFERVLLFVKPEYYSIDKGKLQSQAWDFTKNIGLPPPVKKKTNIKATIAKSSLAVAIGLAITSLIIFAMQH
ncbi:MAG: hypothetical protein GX269_02320 [Clostridiales bacterium]|nr:hypothetical protein [Clostridiales bacterium]